MESIMMKTQKKKHVYYVVDKDTKAYDSLVQYKKHLLIHNSVKQILFTIACKNYISSQLASSFPYSNIFFNLYKMNIIRCNVVQQSQNMII